MKAAFYHCTTGPDLVQIKKHHHQARVADDSDKTQRENEVTGLNFLKNYTRMRGYKQTPPLTVQIYRHAYYALHP
jgi:hypothetical protein